MFLGLLSNENLYFTAESFIVPRFSDTSLKPSPANQEGIYLILLSIHSSQLLFGSL